MRLVLACFVALASSHALAGQRPPDWLAGYWLSCEKGGQTVEVWLADGSGTLVGVNQSAGSFEHMRIAKGAAGAYAFFASPAGAPATEFAMARQTPTSVVFENPAHDFPQRVLYERDGSVLHARIEGAFNGESTSARWTFHRASIDDRCG